MIVKSKSEDALYLLLTDSVTQYVVPLYTSYDFLCCVINVLGSHAHMHILPGICIYRECLPIHPLLVVLGSDHRVHCGYSYCLLVNVIVFL